MSPLGSLVTLPSGVTVRCPPAEGIRKAYELWANGLSMTAIARTLSADPPGYKKVSRPETAKVWVELGKKIAAKRADELSDTATRRVESVTRNLQMLARIEAALELGTIDLDKAIALQLKIDQNLDRVAAGINAASVMPGPVGGGRWALVDLLEGITDRDVAESVLDEHRS